MSDNSGTDAPALAMTESATGAPVAEATEEEEQFSEQLAKTASQVRATEPHQPVAKVGPAQVGPSEIEIAIDDAIHRTLESGASAKWAADGWRGFAVASAQQVYSDRTCRNVLVTKAKGGERENSPAEMWCRPANGTRWESEAER